MAESKAPSFPRRLSPEATKALGEISAHRKAKSPLSPINPLDPTITARDALRTRAEDTARVIGQTPMGEGIISAGSTLRRAGETVVTQVRGAVESQQARRAERKEEERRQHEAEEAFRAERFRERERREVEEINRRIQEADPYFNDPGVVRYGAGDRRFDPLSDSRASRMPGVRRFADSGRRSGTLEFFPGKVDSVRSWLRNRGHHSRSYEEAKRNEDKLREDRDWDRLEGARHRRTLAENNLLDVDHSIAEGFVSALKDTVDLQGGMGIRLSDGLYNRVSVFDIERRRIRVEVTHQSVGTGDGSTMLHPIAVNIISGTRSPEGDVVEEEITVDTRKRERKGPNYNYPPPSFSHRLTYRTKTGRELPADRRIWSYLLRDDMATLQGEEDQQYVRDGVNPPYEANNIKRLSFRSYNLRPEHLGGILTTLTDPAVIEAKRSVNVR